MKNEQLHTAIYNPFPGLRAFEEEEEHLFFGRERQVDELLQKLSVNHFLAVIGSSGSGKSSLVKSGLLPSLFRGFLTGAGSSWKIAVMRPGSDPVGNLAAALAELNKHELEAEEAAAAKLIFETTLRRSKHGLTDAVRQTHPGNGENILIVVDQFEELFRFSRYEKESLLHERDSLAFVNLLLDASAGSDLPLYIAITMRSDFVGSCTEFRGLPEAINQGLYLIPRMTREEIRSAITGPVAVGGATISPMLVNRLLNDVGDNPDQLPILQHALMRTWQCWAKERKPESPLDVRHYEQIGTMKQALSEHAEEAYDELASDRLKSICQTMFKALTEKRPDTPGTRRPTSVADLAAICDATEDEIMLVAEVFRSPERSFLVPPHTVPLSSTSVIDISHESLMRVWNRLVGWVDEEAESAEIYLALVQASFQYEKEKGGLYRAPELDIALRWQKKNHPNKAWGAKFNSRFSQAIAFLEKSEQQRQERFNEKIRYKKRQRRKTIFYLAAGVLLLCMMSAAIMYFVEENVQKKTAGILDDIEVVRSKSLKAAHLAEHTEDSIKMYLASVMAVDAYHELNELFSRLYRTDAHPCDALTFTALDKVFWGEKRKRFSANGDGHINMLITAHKPGKAIYITKDSLFELQVDSESGFRKRDFPFPGDYSFIAFSHDDKYLVASTVKGKVAIFAADNYKILDSINEFRRLDVTTLGFLNNDEFIVAGKDDHTVEIDVISLGSRKKIHSKQFPANHKTIVSVRDSSLAITLNDSVYAYAYRNGDFTNTATISCNDSEGRNTVTALAFSPDGEWLSCGSDSGNIFVLQLRGSQKHERYELPRICHSGKVASLLFYKENDILYLASGGIDGQIAAVQLLDALEEDPKEDPLIISSSVSEIDNLSYTNNGSMLILSDGKSVIAHITDLQMLVRQVTMIRDSLRKVQPQK